MWFRLISLVCNGDVIRVHDKNKRVLRENIKGDMHCMLSVLGGVTQVELEIFREA